jgi:uncharacterized RDD family membrane protein YckC
MSSDTPPGANPYAAPEAELIFPELLPRLEITRYSGFWRRSAAFMIDYVVMFVLGRVGAIGLAVAFMLVGDSGVNLRSSVSLPVVVTVAVVAVLGIYIAYYAGMESSAAQATLGKMAVGIKVCDLQGRRITFGRAVGRFFAKGLSGLLLGVGYLMVAFTEKKQGLHDLMVGTIVVNTR